MIDNNRWDSSKSRSSCEVTGHNSNLKFGRLPCNGDPSGVQIVSFATRTCKHMQTLLEISLVAAVAKDDCMSPIRVTSESAIFYVRNVYTAVYRRVANLFAISYRLYAVALRIYVHTR